MPNEVKEGNILADIEEPKSSNNQEGNVLGDLKPKTAYEADIIENTRAATSNYTGYGESQYDKSYKAPHETKKDIDYSRAVNQPISHELGNAAKRLIPKIGYGILGTAGTIGDLENYAGVVGAIDTDYTNWLTEWANKNKQQQDKDNPIYRKDNDTFSPMDSAWWINHGESVIGSAAEFGLTGFGLGITGNALSKTFAATKYLKGIGQIIDKTNQFATALTLTHAEGVMTGADVYKSVVDEYDNNPYFYDTKKGDYVKYDGSQDLHENVSGVDRYRPVDEDEKIKIASESATEAVRTNYANVLLNITSLSPLFKTSSLTSKLAIADLKKLTGETIEQFSKRLGNINYKDLNKYSTLKTLGREIPQESLEEGINIYAQNQGLAKAGVISEDQASLTNSLLSDEGLLSMGLGAFGAGAQTGIIGGLGKIGNNKEENTFNTQKNQIQQNLSLTGKQVDDSSKELKNLFSIYNAVNIKEAKTSDDIKQKEDTLSTIKSAILNNVSYHNFQMGTTDSMLDILDSYRNTKDEDLEQSGDFNNKEEIKQYKENIDNTKNTILENQKLYDSINNEYRDLPDTYKKDLFLNKASKNFYNKQLKEAQKEKSKLISELQEDISTHEDIKFKPESIKIEDGKLNSDELLNVNSADFYLKNYTKESQAFIKSLPSFKKLFLTKDFDKKEKEIKNNINYINQENSKLESDSYINNTIKSQKDNKENIQKQEATKKQVVTEKQKVTKDKQEKPVVEQKLNDLKTYSEEELDDFPDIDDTPTSKNDLADKFINDELTDDEYLANKKEIDKELIRRQKEELTSKNQDLEKVETLNKEVEVDKVLPFIDEKEINKATFEINKPENIGSNLDSETNNNGQIISVGNLKVDALTIANSTRGFTEDEKGNIKDTDIFNESLTLSQTLQIDDEIVAGIEEFKGDQSEIFLYKDGVKIGAIHELSYVRPERISSKNNNLEKQREALSNLRSNILDYYFTKKGLSTGNSNYTLKVSGKSTGHVFNIKEQISLNDALADNLDLVFVKSTGLYSGQGKQIDKTELSNSSGFIDNLIKEQNGRLLISLPTPNNKSFLQYVQTPRFNDPKLQTVKSKIYIALNAFITNDSEKLNSLGLEPTVANMTEFINNYVYATKTEGKDQLTFGYDEKGKPYIQIFDSKKQDSIALNDKWKNANEIFDRWFQGKFLNVNINNANSDPEYRKELNDLLTVKFKGHELSKTKERVYFANPVVSFNDQEEISTSLPIGKKDNPIIIKSSQVFNNEKVEPTVKKRILESLGIDEEVDDNSDLKFEGLVEGFTALQQRDILNFMLYEFNEHYQSENKKQYPQIISSVKSSFKDLLEVSSEGTKLKVQKVLDNFDDFSNLFKDKLKTIGLGVKENSIEEQDILEDFDSGTIEQTSDEQGSIDENTGKIREENFADDSVFEVNSFKNIGAKLKILLSKIPNGKPTFLNTNQYFDGEVLYYDLMSLFQSSNFDNDSKLDLLLSSGKDKSYYIDIYNLINNADTQTKFQFNKAFNLLYAPKKMVQNSGNNTSEFNSKVFSSDRNSFDIKLVDQWKENEVSRENLDLYTIDDLGNKKVNKEYIDTVVSPLYHKAKDSIEDTKAFLDSLGINLSLDVINQIKNDNDDKNLTFQKVVNEKTWNEQFQDKGLFNFIYKSFLNNSINNEQGIKKLAKYVTIISNNVSIPSYRTIGNKTVYGYIVPNRLLVRLKDIKQNFNNFVDSLNGTSLLNNGSKSFSYFLNPSKQGILSGSVTQQSFLDTISMNPIDGMKQGDKEDAVEYKDLTPPEHEKLKVDLFVNGNKQLGKTGIHITSILTPAKSDKSTGYDMEFILPKNLLNVNRELSVEAKDIISGYMAAEYNRYYSAQEYNKNNSVSIQKLFPQYNPEKFYIFPFLNEASIFAENGELLPYNTDIQNVLLDIFNKHFSDIVEDQISSWKNQGIIVDNKLKIDAGYIHNNLQGLDENQAVDKFAKSYLLANYIGNFEYTALFGSDPASTAKKDVETTLAEYFKRLSKDISPFESLQGDINNSYDNFVLADEILELDKSIESNWKENGVPESIIDAYKRNDKYKGINIADAAEYVTVKEHIFMLRRYGKITDKQQEQITKVLNEGGNLNYKQLGLVLQPIKPLQVGSTFVDLDGHSFEQSVFVKSAQFPLISQLIKGSKLEALNSFMTNHNISRVPMASAVKQGSKRRIKLNDIVNEASRNELDKVFKDEKLKQQYVTTLPRRYMGLQQETPYEGDKSMILEGSQLQKLTLNKTSKKTTDRLNELHIELMQSRFADWKNEYTENGKLNIPKLQARLLKFAKDNNWSLNELQYLNLKDGDFAIPLYYSANPSKIESLFTSDITNNVIKQKLPGFSGILGSTLGLFENWNNKEIESSTITVGNWKFTDGLKPMRFDEKGKVLPAQILVPFKFTSPDGTKIDLRKYVVDGKLDTSKINPEVLKIIGYRIPTQGYNSMAYMEIVGFLPEYTGDLVIAPNEFVVQMGSDFDIDKLYIHRNHVIENENGIDIDNTDRTKELENNIINGYKHVLSQKEIFNDIVKPVEGGFLNEIADEIGKLTPHRNFYSILSPLQQTLNYFKGTLAKSGVGKTSLLSTLNALFRNKKIGLLNKKGSSYNRRFRGQLVSNLSNPKTVTGRNKADVILEIQSVVVDHIKELKADKINYNDNTHEAMAALAMMGEDWDFIGYFLPQESIEMYVNELQNIQNDISIKDKEEEAYRRTISKLGSIFDEESLPNINEQFNNDKDYLKNQLINSDNLAQIAILNDFREYTNIGKELFKVQQGVTVSTSGVGKNLIESLDKEEKATFKDVKRISNNLELLYETPQGEAVNILKQFNKIISKIFPYSSPLSKTIMSTIQNTKVDTGSSKTQSIKQKQHITKFVRASSFSNNNELYGQEDVNTLRERLLFDFPYSSSLASRWKQYLAKNTDSYFAPRIFTSIGQLSKSPSYIKFVNVGSGSAESDVQTTVELISMLKSNDKEQVELAKDTIKYNFIIGGNQDAFNIMKYIPAQYLTKMNFVDGVQLDFNNTDQSIIDTIVKQYFQHNPKEASIQTNPESEDVSNINSKFVSYYDKNSYIWNLYEKIGEKYVKIPTLGYKGFLETDINNYNKVSMYNRNNPKVVNDENTNPFIISTSEQLTKKEEDYSKWILDNCSDFPDIDI